MGWDSWCSAGVPFLWAALCFPRPWTLAWSGWRVSLVLIWNVLPCELRSNGTEPRTASLVLIRPGDVLSCGISAADGISGTVLSAGGTGVSGHFSMVPLQTFFFPCTFSLNRCTACWLTARALSWARSPPAVRLERHRASDYAAFPFHPKVRAEEAPSART